MDFSIGPKWRKEDDSRRQTHTPSVRVVIDTSSHRRERVRIDPFVDGLPLGSELSPHHHRNLGSASCHQLRTFTRLQSANQPICTNPMSAGIIALTNQDKGKSI